MDVYEWNDRFQANGSAAKERPLEDIRAKAISKEHIDEIVNTLFRFAVLAVSSSFRIQRSYSQEAAK